MRKHLLTTTLKTSGTIRAIALNWAGFVVIALSFLSGFSANAQCTIACNGFFSVSLNQSGEALISVNSLLIDPDCNPDDFTVSIYWNSQNIGDVLNCNHLGDILEAKVTNDATGNYCWSNVQVNDYAFPQIFCADTIINCNEETTPLIAGYPTATDNCTVFSNNDFSYADTYINLPCTTIHNGVNVTARIERKWWVADASGLADTCVQMIYLKRASVADIVFPVNLDGFQQPLLDCSQDPAELSLTGVPTVYGLPVVNDDACELSVTFSDLEVSSCGPSSYNIIRTWTAADWCIGTIINHAQIIKVKDITAPEISCPADFTVSASVISCGATVLLPTATAIDDCSDFELAVSWQYGSGNGPFYNVPIGTHQVTYSAEDDCGNISACNMMVMVVDDIAPVNICETALSINISSGGSATIPAVTFDDGSFDNCGISYYEAKRSGMPFGAFVSFDCSDINNGSIPVTFRVFDSSGNFNDCIAYVTIHDNIFPIISCPSTVTLTCGDDFSNTTVTGLPTVVDNCGIDTLYFNDTQNISACGIGTISRVWTVTDLSGHSTTCVQNLIIEDNTPVQVSFPSDYNSSVCGTLSADPSVAGMPMITGDDCESVDFTHTDNVFDIAAPACYTILRNWVVVDWCTYVPNSGSLDGYYTHTQVITITDSEAPTLTVPSGMVAPNMSLTCESDYIVIDSATAVDCNPNVVITNDSPYALSSGSDASGNYPIGEYNINFTANDDCGNVSTATMNLTVVDGMSPSAFCLSGLAINLNVAGEFTLLPQMINAGSSDNCTATADLVLTVFPSTFDCTDLGDQAVILTVKDETGNTATCTTIVSVQDNQFACGQTDYELSGLVMTAQGIPMGNMEMQIINGDTSSVFTDEGGAFSYEQAQVNNFYQVRPYKNSYCANGVSSWDLVLISKHILGLSLFTDPLKIIAADVNRSGSVSTFDMVHLKKLILNIDTAFTSNTSWRFIDADFVFPNPSAPFSSYFPEARFIETLTGGVANLDFMGVKIGDVNGNANPNSFSGVEVREEREELVFEMEEQVLEAEEMVEIIFRAKTDADLKAYQFTIELDTQLLDFVEIIPSNDLQESRVGNDDFGLNQLSRGLITTQWINVYDERLGSETEFFRLRCTAKAAGLLSQAVTIHSDLTKAVAYQGEDVEDVEELNVVNRFTGEEEEDKTGQKDLITIGNSSLSNFPNPFKSHTTIVIDLEEASSGSLLLVDQHGRVWKRITLNLHTGRNEVYLDRNDLPKAGVYFCGLKLKEGEVQLLKKILVID
ncbi:MAG: hypothetical protein ACI9XB_000885 [Gammaproteobacteria bacterium]|jgi:hypothetical protein